MARGCRVWRLYILKGEKPADLLVRTPVKSTCGSQDCQSTRRRGAGHAARRRRQGDRMRLPMAAFGTSRHFVAAQQFGRIWSEADINHRAGFIRHALD